MPGRKPETPPGRRRRTPEPSRPPRRLGGCAGAPPGRPGAAGQGGRGVRFQSLRQTGPGVRSRTERIRFQRRHPIHDIESACDRAGPGHTSVWPGSPGSRRLAQVRRNLGLGRGLASLVDHGLAMSLGVVVVSFFGMGRQHRLCMDWAFAAH